MVTCHLIPCWYMIWCLAKHCALTGDATNGYFHNLLYILDRSIYSIVISNHHKFPKVFCWLWVQNYKDIKFTIILEYLWNLCLISNDWMIMEIAHNYSPFWKCRYLIDYFKMGPIGTGNVSYNVRFRVHVCFVETVRTIVYSFQVSYWSEGAGPIRTSQSQAFFLTFLSGFNVCILHLIDIFLVCVCKHVDLKIFHSFM